MGLIDINPLTKEERAQIGRILAHTDKIAANVEWLTGCWVALHQKILGRWLKLPAPPA